MIERLFSRTGGVVASAAFVVLFGLLLSFRREFADLSDCSANVSSVLGLFVSVVGFILTIWTMWETRRISQAARDEIAVAVEEGQEATRDALDRIGIHLLEKETASLIRSVSDLQQAGTDGQW